MSKQLEKLLMKFNKPIQKVTEIRDLGLLCFSSAARPSYFTIFKAVVLFRRQIQQALLWETASS